MKVEFLESDFTSPTWLRLKEHLEARLKDLRAQNDGRLDADETARMRGRIFEIKAFLALSVTTAPSESDDAKQ